MHSGPRITVDLRHNTALIGLRACDEIRAAWLQGEGDVVALFEAHNGPLLGSRSRR